MKAHIVVTSSSPQPRYCAGTMFTGAKSFAPDHFSELQLYDLLADRLLTVVFGSVLTVDDVQDFVRIYPHRIAQHAAETLPVAGQATELVSGLTTYPAGSQAAVLPAHGETVVDQVHPGGVPLTNLPPVPPVVAGTTHKVSGKK